MRLPAVDRGHGPLAKLKLLAMRLASGDEPPDVVKTLSYRRELFGRAFDAITQAVLRGPSPWSIGERELFAAFTSRLNQCVF